MSTLNAHKSKLYHLGIGTSLSVSNYAYANQHRNSRIFEDLVTSIIYDCEKEENRSSRRFFIKEGNVYVFDSTTISLCLSRFDWTRLHQDKGGIKVHLLHDVKSDVPAD